MRGSPSLTRLSFLPGASQPALQTPGPLPVWLVPAVEARPRRPATADVSRPDARLSAGRPAGQGRHRRLRRGRRASVWVQRNERRPYGRPAARSRARTPRELPRASRRVGPGSSELPGPPASRRTDRPRRRSMVGMSSRGPTVSADRQPAPSLGTFPHTAVAAADPRLRDSRGFSRASRSMATRAPRNGAKAHRRREVMRSARLGCPRSTRPCCSFARRGKLVCDSGQQTPEVEREFLDNNE